MVLEAMNEQLQQMRKDLNEMALHFVKLAEHQQQFADFGDIVKTKIMKLEQKDEDDDGLGPSTHSIGRADN